MMGIMISRDCVVEIHICGENHDSWDMNLQLICKKCEVNDELHLPWKITDYERPEYDWVGIAQG